MLKILLFLAAIWLVLTVLGIIIEGLFWLTVIGLVLLVGTAVYAYVTRSTTT